MMNMKRDTAGFQICPRCNQRLEGEQEQLLPRSVPEGVTIHRFCATAQERNAEDQFHARRYNPDDLAAWERDARR